MSDDEARSAQLTQVQAQEYDSAQVLRGVIEREFPDVRRGIENYIWRWRLARRPEDVAELAEEILHEVVVRALSRPEAYNPAYSGHGWLLRIGVNVLYEHIRRIKRDREHLVQLVDPFNEHEVTGRVSADQLRQTLDLVVQQRDSLMELLELVTPHDRLILQYRYVEKLNGRELAAALGIPENVARVRLHRALQHLSAAYYEAEQAGEGGRE